MGDRANLVAGLNTMTDTFISANNSLLKRRFDERPDSLVTDLPCVFYDIRPATIHYDASLRDRVITTSLVFVNAHVTNDQDTAWRDALVDAFTEHMDDYPHIVGNTWWSDAQWADTAEELSDGVPMAAARVTFDVHFLVGRP